MRLIFKRQKYSLTRGYTYLSVRTSKFASFYERKFMKVLKGTTFWCLEELRTQQSQLMEMLILRSLLWLGLIMLCVFLSMNESSWKFSPPRIRCEPMINPAPMRANGTKTHMLSASSSYGCFADRGDRLVRGFWEKSTDTIIDVRVTNLDSKSYENCPPKKAL